MNTLYQKYSTTPTHSDIIVEIFNTGTGARLLDSTYIGSKGNDELLDIQATPKALYILLNFGGPLSISHSPNDRYELEIDSDPNSGTAILVLDHRLQVLRILVFILIYNKNILSRG